MGKRKKSDKKAITMLTLITLILTLIDKLVDIVRKLIE